MIPRDSGNSNKPARTVRRPPAPRKVARKKPYRPPAAVSERAPAVAARPKPRKKAYRPPAAVSERAPAVAAKPPKPKTPSRAEVRRARAQGRTYASQGKQLKVESKRQKAAKVRRVRRETQRVAPDTTSHAEGRKRQHAYEEKHYGLQKVRTKTGTKKVRTFGAGLVNSEYLQADFAAKTAPVLRVLEQTTRPTHALAGAAKADVKTIKEKGVGYYLRHGGKGSIEAAKRGIQNKDKTTFSDVLKEAGVKNKAVRGIGGFTLDVATDPLTYVGGGTAAVTKRSGVKAAEKQLAKNATVAVARKATPKEARRAAARAAVSHKTGRAKAGAEAPSLVRRAEERALKKSKGRGVTVSIAGQQVPGVARVTRVAAEPVKRVARKTPGRGGAKGLVSNVNPNAAPAGVSKAQMAESVMASRTARSRASHGAHVAQQEGRKIRKDLKSLAKRDKVDVEQYRQMVADAIEHKKIGELPADLKPIAIRARSRNREALRTERQAGIRVGEVKERKQVAIPEVTADPKRTGARLAELRAQEKVSPRELEAAQAAHGAEQTALREQRAARARAEETNAKRAAAPKDYLAHQLTDEGIQAADVKVGAGGPASVGRKAIKPGHARPRVDERNLPLSELRQKFPGQYEEDIGKIQAGRMSAGKESIARAELNQRLAKMGKPVRADESGRVLMGEGEGVYHIVGSNITGPLDKQARQALMEKGTHEGPKRGKYVVLNDTVVKRTQQGIAPALSLPEHGAEIVKAYDKFQSVFKRTAIATLGFHVRNFVGDMSQAYLGQPGHRIPGNLRRASRTLRAHGEAERGLTGAKSPAYRRMMKLSPTQVGKAKLKTPRYGEVTYDEVAQQLRDAGAFRSGYIARELPELGGGGELKATKAISRAPGVKQVRSAGQKAKESETVATARRAILAREDLPRLVTAMEAVRKGATWEEAAAVVSRMHFDYQHLTWFERNLARRAMPFYTWSARNIPLQTKMVVARPGKYANIQKVREEAAKASGAQEEADKARAYYAKLEQAGVRLPKGWEKTLAEWEQRNASIPVRWKGGLFTVSAGLPVQDLNEFPGAALSNQLDEYFQKGMSLQGPLPKNLVEYFNNHSFFFRDQLERDNSPLVSAPAWAKALPPGMKKWSNLDYYVDKQTGKKVLKWRAKADYIIKSVPGTPQYINQLLAQGPDRKGRTRAGTLLAWAGVKSTPVNPVKQAMNLAYARGQEIQKELTIERARGASKEHPTPRWKELNRQLKIVNQIAYGAKAEQGYKVLPRVGGPPKRKRGAAGGLSIAGPGGGSGASSNGGGLVISGPGGGARKSAKSGESLDIQGP